MKESRFHEARTEIEKAKKLDPANVYVVAFLDRINYFEAQKKRKLDLQLRLRLQFRRRLFPSPQLPLRHRLSYPRVPQRRQRMFHRVRRRRM